MYQMGSSYYAAMQLNCTGLQGKPTISHINFKSILSSSFKPILKELQRPPMRLDFGNTIKGTSVRLVDVFVDSMFEFVDHKLSPSQSNFAPIDYEFKEGVDVRVTEGAIPDDFPIGVYIRNGLKSTKSVFGKARDIWVEGEGMLHALYFNKSNGTWNVVYKNRYVESQTFKLEKQRNKPSFLPATHGDSLAIFLSSFLNWLRFGKLNKDMSNTNVFEHSGKLYSVAENFQPQEFDIFTLQTLGDWNVNGAWMRSFTSHPKKAPGSGELVTMGVDLSKPFVEVGVISADGEKLLHKVDLKLNRCTYSHELGVTQRYNIFIDHPLSLDVNRLILGGPLIEFNKNKYAKIGVFPRYGDSDSIRWFDVEPNCTFHILNCFEDGDDEVVVIGCRAQESTILLGEDDEGSKELNELLFSRAHQWRLNMKSGEVKETSLTPSNISMDFPFINSTFTGLRNKYGYTQVSHLLASSISGMPKFGGIAKLYLHEKQTTASSNRGGREMEEQLIKMEFHEFEENTYCTGAAFVAKQGGVEEDDGWIITFVHNEQTNISQVYIIDADNFSSEPVAKIKLQCRVPYGFHGDFFPIHM